MEIFNEEHLIWKYASYHNELDDYLPHAEYLIDKWEAMSFDEKKCDKDNTAYLHTFFSNESTLRFASFLLFDDLLPESARKMYSMTVSNAQSELRGNVVCKSLCMTKQKIGRKRNNDIIFYYQDVKKLLAEGHNKTSAFKIVGKKYHKSPDTIRKRYDASIKRQNNNSTNKTIRMSSREMV